MSRKSISTISGSGTRVGPITCHGPGHPRDQMEWAATPALHELVLLDHPRARAHEAHVAAQHVEPLLQLIDRTLRPLRPRRRRPLHLLAAAVLGALVCAATVAAVAAARGTYDSYSLTQLSELQRRGAAPSWTAPCRRVPRAETLDKTACERVAGRVVWIERTDPDGDGDRHLVLVSRLRIHVVKLPVTFPVPRLPSLGDAVQGTGLVMRGGSGRLEISAERFTADGQTSSRLRAAR